MGLCISEKYLQHVAFWHYMSPRQKGERPVISITPPSSLSFLLIVVHPFVHNCSPQPSAAVKIKDGSYSLHKENTWHSLAKIMPALQDSARSLFHLNVNCALDLCYPNKSKLVKRTAVI